MQNSHQAEMQNLPESEIRGDKEASFDKEGGDGPEQKDQAANSDGQKQQSYDNTAEDLDFQIEENSSDHRQPNHSSTAADHFQDLGAYSSLGSGKEQNPGEGIGSPSSNEDERKGNFENMPPGGKKKSTTPMSG